MVPPLAGLGPDPRPSRGATPPRYAWLTSERQVRVRNVLLGVVMFVALAVWVFHSVAAATARSPEFVQKLRVLGVMTWLYAGVQLLDHRYWQSRYARRRRESTGLPEPVITWLLGQMMPWFGIVYYALTGDWRWFAAGLVSFVMTFWVFPARE